MIAESLFTDKATYYESGVSEAAEPEPMLTIWNWTASRSRHLAPGGGHSRAGTCEAKRRGYGALGRDDIALEITESLNAGIGAPARLMRIAGPRGSGKTVLLCDLRDRARGRGWKTVTVSAGPNLLQDLKDQITDSSLATNASVDVNAGFVSAKVDVASKDSSLRKMLSSAAKSFQGLFIAIDEVQDAPIDDMRDIASTVQLLIGERVDIALAFAGLPAGVMDLINGKALTFLRRALPEDLAPINQVEVALSMGDSFVATGLTIEDDLLSRAAKATKGYAYLVQLVGYSIWQRANLHRVKSAIVSERDVTEGIALAEARFHDVVHGPAIFGLGLNDIKYLLDMCEDKQQSKSHPRLPNVWVKRPMRSALLGPNCYRERLFRRRRGAMCNLPCRT